MVENRNAIWWVFVDAGTINLPLQLRTDCQNITNRLE